MKVNKLGIFTLLRYINYFIGFVRSFVIATALSVSGFGLWSYINTVFSVLQYSNLGVDSYLNYYYSQEHNKGNFPSKTTNLITIIVSILLIVMLPAVAYIMQWEIILNYLVWILIFVVLKLFSVNQNSILRHSENLTFIGFSEIIFSTVLTLPFVVSIIVYDKGLSDSFVIQLALIFQIIFLLIKLILVNIKYKLNPFDIGGRHLSVLSVLKISLLLLSVNAIAQMTIALYRLDLERKFGLEELGTFSFYFSFSYACMMALGAILWAKAPDIIAMLEDTGESERRISLVLRYTRIYVLTISLVQLLGYIFLSNLTEIVLVDYNDKIAIFNEISKYQIIVAMAYFYRVYFIANNRRYPVILGAFLNIVMLGFIIGLFTGANTPNYSIMYIIAIPQAIYFLTQGYSEEKKGTLLVVMMSIVLILAFSINSSVLTILILTILILFCRNDFYALYSARS